MKFSDISASELISAMGRLSGVTMQIHKNFKPIYVSEDYARLYGFDRVEDYLTLDSIMTLIPEEIHELAKQRYAQIIETGVGEPMTLKTHRVDGTVVWVKLQDQRITLDDGDYCVLTVLIDITDEVLLMEQFEQLAERETITRKELESLQALMVEREKQTALSQLLRGMSHQLNTPLGNIRTSASTAESHLNGILSDLKRDQLTQTDLTDHIAGSLDVMSVIDKSVTKATKLIKSVQMMVSEHDQTDKQTFALKPILEDAARLFCQNAQGVTVHISMDMKDDLYIQSNPNIWMQIISVFCENALQHAFRGQDKGRIHIKGYCEGSQYVIQFSDDGHGIAANDQSRVFEAFYSSQMGGHHGIGLSLVYNLVERGLNGNIRLVEPYLKRGASFEIALPVSDVSKSNRLNLKH
ncbi:PAS domain-containing sensor histidine kinase [Reinekea marina]|uniref:histidine kinase n=1 Tax=Reinekea marina TaxID=1310421 RepID=A0ABV7WRV5_9GAMM|nr:PAS domain-containing sensor histidine kinase [Reinekea marina]MDN3650869.1 PAS domain-containing sensor histidine kinase [Reinekea marina]